MRRLVTSIAASVVLVCACGIPPTPLIMTVAPSVTWVDSALTDSARARGRDWRERHFPHAELHGPYSRPSLPDTADDPNDPVAYYRLGVATMDSLHGLADRAFYWATRLDPYFSEAYYARWVLLKKRWAWRLLPDSTIRRRDEAMTLATDSLLGRAIAYDPFVNEPLDFTRLAPYFGTKRRPQRDPAINGAQAYAEGDYRKALTLWANVLRRDPTALLLRVPRAYAWVRLQQPDSAIAELSSVVERLDAIQRDSVLAPYLSKERFHYAIGFLHARQRRFAEARAAYWRALEENLGLYMTHVRLAGVALTQHDTAEALNSMETASMITADDPFVAVYYGALLMQVGRIADARAQYERAIRADSDYALPHLYLGQLLERQGDTVAAFTRYERYLARAARSAPDREWARARLAASRF